MDSCNEINDLAKTLNSLHVSENKEVIDGYKKKLRRMIKTKLKAKRHEFKYEPTLFSDTSENYIAMLKSAFVIRQFQMKEGEIAQIAIGNFYGWEDLGTGHPSGLDCRKKDNSVIMEIKNKYNTCNSTSQKGVLDKLSNYKKKNPNTRCVWAIINPKPKCKILREKIIHNEVELEKIQGIELFKLVFNINNNDYSSEIIDFIKNCINS